MPLRPRACAFLPLCLVAGALGAWLAACGPEGATPERVRKSAEKLEAYCTAPVTCIGTLDVETDYLPHVVHCENGGAPFEALKAQAIVARSYLYYKMETAGSIADGTGDQVYSCGSAPTALQIKAVADTAGQVLRYKGITVCAFFVAGGAGTPPGCIGSSAAATEKYVTYNAGKSGTGITQTTLGWVSPTNYRNRGCLSQLGSRCLDTAGKKADDIIRFYYGDDIVIETATGPCVPTTPPPDAGVDATVPDTGTKDASKDAPTDTTPSQDSGPAVSDVAEDTGTSDVAPSDDRAADVSGSCACNAPGQRRSDGERGAALALVAAALWIARRRRVTH
jgi:hypothetical protein